MTEKTRQLSDDDIAAIVEAMADHETHCRFKGLDPGDVYEAVKFAKNCNRVMDESKSTIRKGLIQLVMLAIVGLLVAGGIVKIKDVVGP